MAAQDLAYQVRGMTTTSSDSHDGTNHQLSGGGGGCDEDDPPGVEEGVEPDPTTLLASLTPVNAAKQGLASLSHNQLNQDQGQGEQGQGQGQGGNGGQESILIAAAENKRSLAAQRARQEAADAVLLCLSQSFLPALQVLNIT